MNKHCYGTDCDEEQCRCHDEEVLDDVQLDFERMALNKAMTKFNTVLNDAVISNKIRIDAAQRVVIFINSLINEIK